jgi:hypothetical protein
MRIMRCNPGWRSIIFSAFILAVFPGFQNVQAAPSALEISQAQEAGKHNEYAMLTYLVPVLLQARKAGRIYYAPSSCVPDENDPDPFPTIDMQPPPKETSGLAAVREIFRHDHNIKVKESPSGIIRIRIGKIPDAILQTKLSRIYLMPIAQYNPVDAILAIERSEEVQAAMHRLGIHQAFQAVNVQIVMPAPGLPHLPKSIDNLTMEQALDLVAQTFRGIVEYGACTKLHVITVNFTGGPNFDLSGYQP